MKHVTELYPRRHVDTSGAATVGQAGGVLLVETIRTSGIDRGLSAALRPWRKPLAVLIRARSCLISRLRWRSAGTAWPT